MADFTYVPMASGGFGYTAFIIDAYAGLIAGWHCSLTADHHLVKAALNHAVELRARQGHPMRYPAVHNSDAGTQYTAVHFGQQLVLAGIRPSIGTVGDAYDNALAETLRYPSSAPSTERERHRNLTRRFLWS